MPERFYTDLFYVLLALIIAALLGFLIGRLMKSMKLATMKKSLDACYKSNEELKRQLNNTTATKIQSTHMPSSRIAEEPMTSSFESNFDSNNAKLALGKTIKENDLKIVEGIGPKIEELLNKDGISTWNQLAKAPVSRLQTILKNGGDRFLLHKPDTWSKQALLAYEGKWNELKNLQDYLDGGKEPTK